MNKKQAAEQIGTLFQSAFNRENYTHFLRNLLNDFDARNNHYSGNTVPDAFKQHINQYWRVGKYTDPETVEMDLYVVEVNSLLKLDRARTALRNFAVRTMQTFGDKDHALIAFYTRSAFEQTIRNHCDKKRKPVKFRAKQKKYTSEDFWDAVKDGLEPSLVADVEQYRNLVLNAFSHYNTEKHEIRTELEAAIETIQNLKTELC